jgi:hypothetical protein
MKDEVFNLHGLWFVSFSGKTTGPFNAKGPALACLEQLAKGNGVIMPQGNVKWLRNNR